METVEEKTRWTDRVFTSVNVLMMIAGVAAIVLIVQWFDMRNQINKLQFELAARLASAENYNRESRQRVSQALDAERSADVRLGILEKKMSESQNQQVALEAMYQELAKNRDEFALSDLEQILLIANEQLQLAGNVKTALIAMENADNVLLRLNRPELLPLRKAISRDIEKLKAVSDTDIAGASLHLDNLLAQVDKLPLIMEARPQASAARSEQQSQGFWFRLGREAWDDIRQLIRVQYMQSPGIPPLSPSQAYFLRENLKLRILSARLCLLGHDEAGFRSNLKEAESWMNRYFDPNAQEMKVAATNLRQISAVVLSVGKLDINDSLNAVHNYRLARDRSQR